MQNDLDDANNKIGKLTVSSADHTPLFMPLSNISCGESECVV